jgi:hypothetical protein
MATKRPTYITTYTQPWTADQCIAESDGRTAHRQKVSLISKGPRNTDMHDTIDTVCHQHTYVLINMTILIFISPLSFS